MPDKEKLIIENRSALTMAQILPYVERVISMGRISDNNTAYCYVTTFTNGLIIAANRNDKSDRFVVYEKDDTHETPTHAD